MASGFAILPILLLVGLLGILLLAAIWAIAAYNGLVRTRNEIDNAWSQIDVQLKRRHDLVPNLVETVKGYAAHEKTTLENVIAARNKAMNANGVEDKMQAENQLTGALKTLFALSEAYPDLKANQSFLALQEELTSTENKVAFARQFFNDRTLEYNTRTQTFPTNLLAGMFSFGQKPFFKVETEAERAVPKVTF